MVWTTINLSDRIKQDSFQAVAVLVQLNEFTTWTLSKRLDKKIEKNDSKVLRVVLNKSWKQQPTKQQLYNHLHPISQTIQVSRVIHARHCYRSKDRLISDVLLWTHIYGYTSVDQSTRIYLISSMVIQSAVERT